MYIYIYIYISIGDEHDTTTGEPLSYQFLIQRLSVAIQCGNAMSILGTLHQSDLAYDVDELTAVWFFFVCCNLLVPFC